MFIAQLWEIFSITTGVSVAVTDQVANLAPQPRRAMRHDELQLVAQLLFPRSGGFPFVIDGLPAGSYHLYPVFVNNLNGRAERYTGRTLIHIVDSDIADLVIPIRPNSAVAGRMAIDGQIPPSSLESIRLELRPADRLPTFIGSRFLATIDRDALEFAFADVPEGLFALSVTGLPENVYVADVRYGAGSIENDGIVEVSYGTEQRFAVVLSTGAGEVRGLVSDALDRPAPGATITLIPAAPRSENAMLYRRVTSDDSGQYAIRGIAPGNYRLLAWPEAPAGSAETNAEFVSRYDRFARAITVSRGIATLAELELIPNNP